MLMVELSMDGVMFVVVAMGSAGDADCALLATTEAFQVPVFCHGKLNINDLTVLFLHKVLLRGTEQPENKL